jgi:hypothetical protein
MSPTTPPPTDPTAVLEQLDARAIMDRLAELAREAAALRVLLRAARARGRTQGGQTSPRDEGARS